MPDVLQKMFGVPKPVIAMAHFPALPGTPRYDASRGMEGIVDWDASGSDPSPERRGGRDSLLQ